MERSMNSSMGKLGASGDEGNLSCPEESGWTAYFEDFSQDNNNVEQASCSSLGGSSLLSDAAFGAAWKFSSQNHPSSSVGGSPSDLPKKLGCRKSRTKQMSEDDPLEDTASSPVNSPKIGGLNSAEMVARKTDDPIDGSMDKRFASEQYSELQTDEKHEINLNGKNIDCTDLKKRGLCLVPLSMLVNFFG